MLDPVGEECDLHIRAAGIFVMQLELLEIQRLVTLSHNEGPIVAEEPGFATAQRGEFWSNRDQFSRHFALSKGKEGGERHLLRRMAFPFAVVPQAKLFTRTDSAGTADDYAKEFGQKISRRMHAQFPG